MVNYKVDWKTGKNYKGKIITVTFEESKRSKRRMDFRML